MSRLFKAFMFKLRKDITFRVTLIIGAGVAIFLTLLYLILDYAIDSGEHIFLNGQSMLIGSLSPTQNFGLAIPINLITYTVLEFTQGSIRNKIISGHSKAKIYLSLYLNGLIFAFSLLIVYTLICFGLGSAIGGFDPHGSFIGGLASLTTGATTLGDGYILKILLMAFLVYSGIVAFTIFFASLFRNIGPTIPVVIVVLIMCNLITSFLAFPGIDDKVVWAVRIINPLHALSANEPVAKEVVDAYGNVSVTYTINLTNETFFSGIGSNVFYILAFFFGGLVIFKHRDVK